MIDPRQITLQLSNNFVIADPCDGKCYGNPSGLFADNYNPYGFIQCGCDYKYGKACICCKPLHVKCPKGAIWDDYAKVGRAIEHMFISG